MAGLRSRGRIPTQLTYGEEFKTVVHGRGRRRPLLPSISEPSTLLVTPLTVTLDFTPLFRHLLLIHWYKRIGLLL